MASTPAPNNLNGSDLGDVVDSDDECEVETDAEPRSRYWDHLYCPLSIGEVLNARYRIEHKLGWGGFSTVWLAHDIYENKAVALKVVVPGERGGYEHAIQDVIKRNVRDISRLVVYEALFYHPGREGRHHPVFVFPVRGPSLDTTCSRLPPKFRVPAARSLLLALKSLHDAGVVHRGKFTWHESLLHI
jgi:serine/threonine protein kinase